MNENEFQKLLKEHNELLASAEGRHKSLLTEKQKKIFQEVRENFIDKLETDAAGNVTISASNIAMLNSIDTLFDKVSSEIQKNLVKTFAANLSGMIQSNANYYSAIEGKAKVLPLLPKVNKAMSGWLGITNGTPQKNGFIDQLINDTTAKIAVKNTAMKIVIGQQGLEAAKGEMKTLIEGNKDRLGMFEKHYKTFANDLYSQIDRATSNVIRNDLKFEFAIYVGGLVETSREFCIEHNAKVFHVSEILKFKPEVGIPPNYDPIHDLGGYNCRHYLRWISTAMAKAKGKNVEDFIDKKPKVEPKPEKATKKAEPKPKAGEKTKVEEKTVQETPKPFLRIPMKQDFNKIEPLKIKPFKTSEEWDKTEKEISKLQSKYEKLKKQNLELVQKDKAFVRDSKIHKNNPTRMEEIRKGQSENYKEWVAVYDELKATNSKVAEIGKVEFLKMLNSKKQTESTLKLMNKPKAIVNLDEGFEIFKKLASNFEMKNEFIVNKLTKAKKHNYGRAHYKDTENSINVLPTETLSVVIHEFVHSLENNNFVLKSAVDFLNKRTAGKSLRKLKEIGAGYSDNELFKDGGFHNEYVGKIYSAKRGSIKEYNGIRATEILTMGVERMLRNPFEFYKNDKEYFEFIHNLLLKDL